MIENARSSVFQGGGYKKIWIILPLCLVMLNVTGCDYINDKLYPTFRQNKEKAVVDKPPFARQNSAPNISIEKVRDIAESSIPDDNSFTVNPVALNNQMGKPKGTNTAQLFSQPVGTPEDRFQRIENSVQKISDTISRMSPSITKLMGIENELDALTFQLEELINKGVYDETEDRKIAFVEETQTTEKTLKKGSKLEPKTETKPKTKSMIGPMPQSKSKPESKSDTKLELKLEPKPTKTKTSGSKIRPGDLIHTMRLGDHSGKTRIVFETTEKLDYTLTIDNDEKIATITFPKGNMGSNPNVLAYVSDLVKSIEQDKENGGTTIAFELTQKSEKLKGFRISPDKEIPRHRIVIDLKR